MNEPTKTESVLIDGVAYTLPIEVACELLRLNIELLTAQKDAAWQPIETAPKDETLLGFVPHSMGGYLCPIAHSASGGGLTHHALTSAESSLAIGNQHRTQLSTQPHKKRNNPCQPHKNNTQKSKKSSDGKKF